jgi:hypothetical protein
VRAVALWRALRQFRRRLDDRLVEMSLRMAGTEKRVADAGRRVAQLDRSRISLQESVARALVLGRAASDASALLGRVRGFYPSK